MAVRMASQLQIIHIAPVGEGIGLLDEETGLMS